MCSLTFEAELQATVANQQPLQVPCHNLKISTGIGATLLKGAAPAWMLQQLQAPALLSSTARHDLMLQVLEADYDSLELVYAQVGFARG